jgi:L-aminopeptidase/D-esterase-like protein
MSLPAGFSVGHATDRERWTGCTAILAPDGTVAAGEVRGGGPGTRESDLLSPAASATGVQAVLFAGGSAFGLTAADGVVRYLEEQGRGTRTPVGAVPLVAAAIVFDLALGDPAARPTPDDAHAACARASGDPERGSVGAGTGCTVGTLLGPDGWTKGGLGLASLRAGEATVAALAVVNAFGEVIDADGAVLAGIRRDGRFVRTVELLQEGVLPAWRTATTLACVMTDAALTKTEAWLVARAATAGVARAVVPSATALDGDFTCCLAAGEAQAPPLVVSAVAADAVAAAIRDAVVQASGAPGCPAVSEI